MKKCRIKNKMILWLPVFVFILFTACTEEKKAEADSPITIKKNLTGEILPTWLPDSLAFSADGTRSAYAAQMENRRIVVTDGRHLTYAAKKDNRTLHVVDGKEVREHDVIFSHEKGTPFFDRENRLCYIANRGRSIYLMKYSF